MCTDMHVYIHRYTFSSSNVTVFFGQYRNKVFIFHPLLVDTSPYISFEHWRSITEDYTEGREMAQI